MSDIGSQNSHPGCSLPKLIAKILGYQIERESGGRRFLRVPQIQALEAYCFLRLMEKTPRIIDLYRRLYPKKTDLYGGENEDQDR